MNTHPIILVEDDTDDLDYLVFAFSEIKIPNRLIRFSNAFEALDYLRTTEEETFMIISDVNMPKMNGLQFKAAINADAKLLAKRIPFIFYSTGNSPSTVISAYDLHNQGFFKKHHDHTKMIKMLQCLIDYWCMAELSNHKNDIC